MGQDAKVDIWVGMEVDGNDELPEGLQEIEKAIDANFSGDYLYDEIAFSFFESAEFKCGFGVQVFSHDWDYGVKEFDIPKLQTEIDHVTPIVKKAFLEWGLPEPKVLLQTDFF